ncbi:ABC transporter ATP-binding protein [Clostridium algidicarnis]|uniref:ABC transporter ATP-binding protein n=1 Tax=Clostridium algidicarnis TaxID=37659 RepID=A0ABS6C0D4_9CLOT|nr:ABC transporter ATP-binding protein [Clostridium algidicarnis]MBU3194183.1 ABC transporter ATP-binding protein [Clostridium algidicarnis]MBU3195091.1 ABC transporter ATP-binding protein [Clostridium algidicarnis]MBU3218924.1 ABC transporter ATP-binding protein [Clostridium algidicarnis]MBU3229103.1 ABC transporter ATP-binding protein [Clostridium algidicarnis]MBU3251876.1 ABC transporter ATP-binding protein [Clostridium algidicarnis]
MESEKILEIKDLHTGFRFKDKYFDAVDGVSLTLNRNELLAIVGESGCGKSTIANSIVGLHNSSFTKVSGEIIYKGENILNYSEEKFNKIRGKEIGFIFQDPLASLNPLHKIGRQIEESLIYHTDLNKKQRLERMLDLLNQVGIVNPEKTAQQFPHELSGGMRQRVLIAIALSCKPNIIIADEPTTALDVTIQAQILDLLAELQKEINAGIILITHDLGVVAQNADRVAVMYAGQIVELADAKELFNNPLHPYTKSLLNSIPNAELVGQELHVIKGMVPSLENLPRKGCRFKERIPWISDSEHEEDSILHEVSKGHFVRCTCWKNFYFENEVGC